MHDPSVVVFDVHIPFPVKRWSHREARNGLLRRRFVNPEHLGQPIDAGWRPKAWELFVLGRRIGMAHFATVWHEEPEGRDSGSVCKGMGGSDLTWHNVRWAWKHRSHLSVQVHPYLRVRRWLFDRCDECGHRFFWKQARFGYMGGDKVFHQHCQDYLSWKGKANERLDILDLVADVWNVDAETVRELARNRSHGLYDEAGGWNKAWRVFYDLDNARKARSDGDTAGASA